MITAEHLPIDIVIEILCRLPIKSLTVLKCVSKSWNKLISHVCIPRVSADVCILNLYTGFLRRFRHSWYLSDKKPEVNYVGSIPKDKGKGEVYHEIDCCNGLSLYKCHQPDYASRYVVANVATNQCFRIPEPLEHVKSNYAALIFDPVQSKDYKVVLPHSYLDHPRLDIFSSENGKWVRHFVPGDWVKYLFVVESDAPYYRGFKWAKKAVHLDRMLYMLTEKKYCVQFDLKSATVSAQVIELPSPGCETGTGLIENSRGVLYYLNYDEEFRLLMWQFDYHSTSGKFWEVKHCICINDLLDNNQAIWHTLHVHVRDRQPCRLFEPYGVHPLSDIIFLGLQGKVYTYHLGSHKCELVWKPERILSWRRDFIYAFSYSYVNVKDFHKADHDLLSLTTTTENVK
ncbi:hypothetical protein MKW94_002889 [Papaver nudicaule]|uniref:F-box domain-containing protein n=1 Tax=Papaver nudicaule TaxID=74823 RepID=A0AA41VT11_PAPNU|nr:hypothetical protein [Papaver nudicaule]